MSESSPPNLGTPKPGTTNVAQPEPPALDTTDDVRDELPHDLDPSGFVGPYQFPDNSRRRWPGVIYLVIAALCVGVYFAFPDSPIVNVGWLVAAGLLTAAAVDLDHVRVADARRRDRGARGGAGRRRVRDRPRLGATGLAWTAQPPDVARALLLRRGPARAAGAGARRRDRRRSGATSSSNRTRTSTSCSDADLRATRRRASVRCVT